MEEAPHVIEWPDAQARSDRHATATRGRTRLLPAFQRNRLGAKLNSIDHHGLNQPENLDCHAVRYVHRLAPNNCR